MSGSRNSPDALLFYNVGVALPLRNHLHFFSINHSRRKELLRAVGLVVLFSLLVREVAGSIPARPLFKPPELQSYAHNRVAPRRKDIFLHYRFFIDKAS